MEAVNGEDSHSKGQMWEPEQSLSSVMLGWADRMAWRLWKEIKVTQISLCGLERAVRSDEGGFILILL